MIYLDYSATTPISETGLHVFNEVSKRFFGNTNSLHDVGTSAKNLYDKCRLQLAKLIGGPESSIHFTNGGSDANRISIDALLAATKNKGNHIITTDLEHKSILNHLEYLEKNYGYEVTKLRVNAEGLVDINKLKDLIRSDTVLVTIQHVNSEIGVIQPLREIGQILKEKKILFHSDCVQSFCKLPIEVDKLGVDSLSISSHKVYGPKGVGAIYLQPSTSKISNPNFQLPYGGTVNLPGIASFVSSAQETADMMNYENRRLFELREYFINQAHKRHLDLEIISSSHQLGSIIGLVIGNIQGDYAMLEFNRYGIAVSTGSACTVGQQEPSKTLLAIGKDESKAKQFIRISMGKSTTKQGLDHALDTCEQIIHSFYRKEIDNNE